MTQEGAPDLIIRHQDSGTAIMWATMALARLKVKAPSFTEAFDLSANHGSSSALHFHNAFQSVVDKFANESEIASEWRNLDHADATILLQQLIQTGQTYYQDTDPEFLQLCSFLTSFHNMTKYADQDSSPNLRTPQRMETNLRKIMTLFLQAATLHFMECIDQGSEALRGDTPSGALQDTIRMRNIIRAFTDSIHGGIKRFIKKKTERLLAGHIDACSDVLAQTCAGSALRRHIRDSLQWLVVKIDAHPLNGIANFDFLATAFMIRFCSMISQFFTYASPMLRDVPDDDTEDGEDEVARWYWQEYNPNDLQDMLTEPENVEIDQVSVSVSNTTSSICLICQESRPLMRKANACGHEYCEECLQGQLQSQHAARYKCAACRVALV